jgi:uncharacterized protein YdeI (YjbR/CyaY-like superfamily)
VKPRFFKSSAEFRSWLATNRTAASELWVGFYKKESGKGGITYSEALDEALCFGWIDGVRKSVDPASYTIRFSPRQPKSIWSAVNTRRVAALIKAGSMDPSGLEVFRNRDPGRTLLYSYERERAEFTGLWLERFRSNAAAWRFFDAQAPSYKRTVTFWVMSAKKEETRSKRLDALIAESALSRRIGLLSPPKSRDGR